MDRLFLAGLVPEIDAAVRGSRVRSVRLESDRCELCLELSRPAEIELAFHLGADVAGLYIRAKRALPARASPREAQLSKLLGSSVIQSVGISDLDRVVTVSLEQTRLSGRKRRFAIVIELVATRSAIYLVDSDSNGVVEVLSHAPPRLAVGDRFRPLDPPPHAAPAAADGDELERRLGRDPGTAERGALLAATGWTPLLVRELMARIQSGATAASAFDELHRELQAAQPVLYRKGRRLVLSPVTLTSEPDLVPEPMASFNDAMAESVKRSGQSSRIEALRHRLAASIGKRASNLASLKRKLERQRAGLADPDELRRRGETLLAGLAQAERIGDGRLRLSDPFDPGAGSIEMEIDPRWSLPDNAQRLFQRSRKVERTRKELSTRVEALGRELDYLESARMSLEDATGIDEIESLRREAEEQGILASEKATGRRERRDARLPPRTFKSRGGHDILVGRSARSNEDVTFDLAKPHDLWFHAHGIPGSHVVLKRPTSEEVDEEDILEAAGYAAHYSRARNDSHVEVMVTERRHVSKIKGAPPGLVKVASFRTVRVPPAKPEPRLR